LPADEPRVPAILPVHGDVQRLDVTTAHEAGAKPADSLPLPCESPSRSPCTA
jgi:hypothetical protein